MGTIFSSSPEKKLFLYSCGASVYFRTAFNAEITRPVILCNDFSSSLSSVVFNDIIYYSYQNTDGDLILRSVLDSSILFHLSSSEAPGYFSPLLIPHDKDVLFLFFIKNPLSEQYILKYTRPFEPTHIIHEVHTFSSLPTVHHIPFEKGTLLSCFTHADTYVFKLEEKDLFYEVKIKSLPEELIESDKNKKIILEKENEILNRNNELLSLKKEVSEKDNIIESITGQYNALMDTAYRYREEAEKWYTKYYSRK